MSKLENELNNALASLASVLNSADFLKSLNTNSLKKVECTNHKIHNDLNDVLAQSLKALSTLDVDNHDVETSEACNAADAADAADADKQYGEGVKQTKEMVNHPSHYRGNKFEVIDIIEDYNLNFNLGNAIKYILRCGKKDTAVQELKKAVWYLNREIETLSK